MFKTVAPAINLIDVDSSHIEEIARLTEGFSGREIEKVMVAIQGSVYGSDNLNLTAKMLLEEVRFKVHEHCGKIKMSDECRNWS